MSCDIHPGFSGASVAFTEVLGIYDPNPQLDILGEIGRLLRKEIQKLLKS